MVPSRDRIANPRASSGRPWPIGARLLVPGYPQWSWGQRERALILFGSYASALLAGAFSWGTLISLGLLGFAFATHAFSAADAIRQHAFPGFGRLVPAVAATSGLGAICYAPALAMASAFAWPIAPDERPREGYLVNRWAYRIEGPRAGETVWLRSSRGARAKVARIVAAAGQRIEWSGGQFRVDDQVVEDCPFRAPGEPDELKMTVPEGYALVSFRVDAVRGPAVPGGWEVVERADIRGRAWARSYPFWDRKLLR